MLILKKQEEYIYSAYQFSLEEYVHYVLDHEHSPFIQINDKLILKTESFTLNDMAYEYFVQSAKTLSVERIQQWIIQKGKISPEVLQTKLNLEADVRFGQVLHYDRWFLTEWEICNNEVYNWLQQEQWRQTTLVDLYQLVKSRFQEKDHINKIFIPDIDPRFEIRKKGKVFIHQPTEEEIAVHNQKTFDLVIEQIKEAIELLHMRNEEMSAEVVQHFNANNLEAIQSLMDEKKDSLELQQDLTTLIEKWKNRG